MFNKNKKFQQKFKIFTKTKIFIKNLTKSKQKLRFSTKIKNLKFEKQTFLANYFVN